MREVIRRFIQSKIGGHLPRTNSPVPAAEMQAAVRNSADWVDAAIAALGLELGEAYKIDRNVYGVPAETVLASVQANVFAPAHIDAVTIQVTRASTEPTKH